MLLEALERWARSKYFTLERKSVARPIKRSKAEEILALCPSARDLADFYSTASGECDIRFLLDLHPANRSERITIDRASVHGYLAGGFGLLSPKSVLETREELKNMVKHIAATRKFSRKGTDAMASVLEVAAPFWLSEAVEFLMLIGPNPILREGVYCFEYASLYAPGNAMFYCETFPQWLSFLERNLYLGRGISALGHFRGRRLRSRPKLCEGIMKLAELPRS